MKKFKKSSSNQRHYAGANHKQRNMPKILLGIFIVFILLSSAVGYFSSTLFGNEPIVSVNGRVFKLDATKNNLWYTLVNDEKVYFTNLPDSIINIDVDENALNLLKTSPILYGTYDPDSEFKEIYASIEYELDQSIMAKNSRYFVYSFTKDNSFGKPVISCQNSSSSQPVLFFQEIDITEKPSIKLNESCIILSASDGYSTLALRDELFYRLFDIK